MKYIQPPRLQKGDIVGVISPSGFISNRIDIYKRAKSNIEKALDIKIIESPHALTRHWGTSAPAHDRVQDFHDFLQDETVKAVFFSVGGDNASDLLELLDYSLFAKYPKIICGISDATTLLNAITAKTGLITYHGLEFLDFADNDMTYEVEYMKRAFCDTQIGKVKQNKNWKIFRDFPTQYHGWETIRDGLITGRVIGGNFKCFAQLLFTGYEMPLEGNVLLVEHYEKSKRLIHQRLMQFRLQGVYDKIGGLVLGYTIGSDNLEVLGNDRTLKDIALEVTRGYDFPILHIGELGHRLENIIFPIGGEVTMDATNKTLIL